MINVIIVEDNSALRERLMTLMNQSQKLECVRAIESVEAFLRMSHQSYQPQIILLDIGLPGMSGLEGIPIIKEIYPDAAIVILTTSNAPDKVFRAICAGATGYLLKDIDFDFLETSLIGIQEKGGAALSPQVARRVLDYFQRGRINKNPHGVKLKPKEYVIVKSLVDGLSYEDIAHSLELSIDGVRYYIKNIYKKLQVNSKSQVIRKYMAGEVKIG